MKCLARAWLAANQQGLSLIELLIALALTSIIFALLFGSLDLGRRAWKTVDEIERVAPVEAVQTTLADLIGRAEAIPQGNPRGQAALIFEGEPNVLRFAVNVPGRATIGGLHVIAITKQPLPQGIGGPAFALHLVQTLLRQDATAPAPSYPRVLLTDIDELSFRYFGAATRGIDDQWIDRWPSTTSLPKLIEMRVRFRKDDGRSWMPLIVELKLRVQP